jgi:hypothetical protein
MIASFGVAEKSRRDASGRSANLPASASGDEAVHPLLVEYELRIDRLVCTEIPKFKLLVAEDRVLSGMREFDPSRLGRAVTRPRIVVN